MCVCVCVCMCMCVGETVYLYKMYKMYNDN